MDAARVEICCQDATFTPKFEIKIICLLPGNGCCTMDLYCFCCRKNMQCSLKVLYNGFVLLLLQQEYAVLCKVASSTNSSNKYLAYLVKRF